MDSVLNIKSYYSRLFAPLTSTYKKSSIDLSGGTPNKEAAVDKAELVVYYRKILDISLHKN